MNHNIKVFYNTEMLQAAIEIKRKKECNIGLATK